MFENDVKAVEALKARYDLMKLEIGKRVIGQETVVKEVLIAIFSRGHALLVGVPGLAKTMLIQSLSQVLDLSFNRIQFTPDLMPSDILGAEILDQTKNFKYIKGPIFANLLLADEINRTPPKTQSALLEAMQEKAVTIAGQTHVLPHPFFVLATQNPIEQEGTYPLPEAQLDRFMFEILLDYPSLEQEIAIVQATTGDNDLQLSKLLNAEELLYFQHLIRKIPVPESLYAYAVQLVASTRPQGKFAHELSQKYFSWGAGPRASQNLIIGAKAHAALHGKFSPDQEDVKAIALQILRHRVVKNYKAEADGLSVDDILKRLL